MIDVIVPLYNKQDRIIRCLNSIFNQTVLPKKVIVINDGSSDSSIKKAKEAINKYKGEYELVTTENKGVSAARNFGVSLSNSEFVAFLDADDFWDPRYIEKAIDFLKKNEGVNVLTCFHKVLRNGKLLTPRQGMSKDCPRIIESYSWSALIGSPVNSSKVIIRRSALDHIGGFPEGEALTEDLYVWLRLSTIFKFHVLNEFLVIVDKSKDSERPTRVNADPYVLKYFLNPGKFQFLKIIDVMYLRKIFWVHSVFAIKHGTNEEGAQRIKLGQPVFPFSCCFLYALNASKLLKIFG